MEVYATEEQQVEAIKRWWKENAKSVIGGILIGVGVLYGGKTWMQQENQHAEQASNQFEVMMQAIAKDSNKEAAEHGAELLGQYADTPYAGMAALALAKIRADEKDLTTAKTHLRYALANLDKPELKHVARLRLVRVLTAEGNYDEAMQLVVATAPDTFVASYEELKGDIHAAKGEVDQARTAYTLALAAMEPGSRAREFVEIKRDDLGEATVPGGEQ